MTKIIYVTNARIPTEKAHGLQIMKMCEAFAQNKVAVELVIPTRFNTKELRKQNPFEYYGVKRNFKIKKLLSIGFIPLNKFLGKLGFWIQSLSFAFFSNLYLIFKRVNIIYSRDQFVLFLLSFFKKEFIYEIHKLPKKIKSFHKKIWKKAKKLIVLTDFIKKELIKAGVPENKILVAPDGVDIEKFDINISKKQARKKLNLPQDKKLIIYTGHLYKWKGVQILAETSQFLPENTEIYFVGGTNKDIKKFKIQWDQTTSGLPKSKIQIVGHRPHSEVPYWLKAADVLVLTGTKKSKRSRKYTSPMKMFEYVASKRPIVASDLPSFREILNPSTSSGQGNAILVKPDRPKALAEGIKKILDSPEIAKRISNQAHKDVQSYAWDKRAKRILKFIIEI